MSQVIDSSQFRRLFLDNVPMMDMRAPIEFNKGAFPNTVSLPLMTDRERQKVGTCYRRDGQEAAITLGHQLVAGETKQQRLARWLEFSQQHPQGILYCFRGGLRSHTVQSWMAEAGVDMPLIEGGYKALRQFLLAELERLSDKFNMVIIAGHTGSAKTVLINQLDNGIDLEGLANHRGSSFGRHINPQPSQIDFENALAIALMRAEQAGHTTIVLEDESHLIGRCAIPLCVRRKSQLSPIVEIERTRGDREQQIYQEYVVEQSASFQHFFDIEEGEKAFARYLTQSLGKIQKRLGDVRFNEIEQHLNDALLLQEQTGEMHAHLNWIRPLLVQYYDPMYSFQFDKKSERVVFRGEPQAVRDYLSSKTVQGQ